MKKLLVYYSKTGTVDKLAKMIAKKFGADLYQIKSQRIYAPDMWKAWDEAQEEIKAKKMPEINDDLPDLSSYDEIIVGGPVWGYSISNPIHAYLNQTNFQNKPVSAFWTYYDHDEKYVQTFKAAAHDFKYIDGLPLSMSIINNESLLNEAVDKWLATLN